MQSPLQKLLILAALVLGSLVFLVPFYFVLNGSLGTNVEASRGTLHELNTNWIKPAPTGSPDLLAKLPQDRQESIRRTLGDNAQLVAIDVDLDRQPVVYRALMRVTEVKPNPKGDETLVTDYIVEPDAAGNAVVSSAAPQWQNYPRSLSDRYMNFAPALANTVVITVCCVIGQIISCSLVGFGFARFKFRGRGLLFMLMLSTMMLPGQVTMIPVFLLFRSLGMIDTFWPLILPAWFASPFFVFMFRQFFSQIPEELIEAARIDGCSNWRIYWQIMMPLCGPVIAIVAIYTFLGTWNDFLGPLIYLNSDQNRTIALALNSFRGQYGTSDAHLLMAASVVCMAPCVILFFACQKYFVESVAQSGMK